jgi:ATP-dependent Clp protease ATP-binding subunit ClpC
MFLELTDKAKDFLVEKGFDDKFGARPLRRALQKYVEDSLADQILRNNLQSGYKITGDVDESGDKLKFIFTEIEVINTDDTPSDIEDTSEDKIENIDNLGKTEEHDESVN